MNVEDLIVPSCQRCEEHAVIHQFGWGAEGSFYALLQCKYCGHVDWFCMDALDIVARLIKAQPKSPEKECGHGGYV